MDRGVWQATVHGVTKSQTRLSTHAHWEGLETSTELDTIEWLNTNNSWGSLGICLCALHTFSLVGADGSWTFTCLSNVLEVHIQRERWVRKI